MNYHEFIVKKTQLARPSGFEPDESVYPNNIKDHQRAAVSWACRRARAAMFHDTGLGKTLTQLTWADQVARYTEMPVLIIAPLAVSYQTSMEASRFGLSCTVVNSIEEVTGPDVYVTNYEKSHKFRMSTFAGIVLDESSILKGLHGKLRKYLTTECRDIPYKLSCTATPSPNDFIELGTQCEWLGIMSQVEMLSMFFTHDGSETQKWRLKGHAKQRFWEWLSTWSMFLLSPADLGFDGSEYRLPPIKYHNHVIETEPNGSLFVEPAEGLLERNRARKDSISARCRKAAEIVNDISEPVAVWCHLNDESRLLTELIDGAVEVTGADDPEHKTTSMLRFANGEIKAIVSKPKIAGFGMNWQISHHCVFVGLSDSWESFYQAIRREWRFGQEHSVHVHIISADTEGLVVENIRRKNRLHDEMSMSMMDHMRDFMRRDVLGAVTQKTEYVPDDAFVIPKWLESRPLSCPP